MDESLKRQGFQGKVAAQDGVICSSTVTLTWLGFGGPGWGWSWPLPQDLGGWMRWAGSQERAVACQLLSERLHRGTEQWEGRWGAGSGAARYPSGESADLPTVY